MKNQSSITRFHLDSLYRIMLKRIGKGFSTDDLSFLMSRETDYVNQVETLMVPFYSEDDLKCIAAALAEDNVADLLVEEDDEVLLTIAVEHQEQEQSVTTTFYAVDEDEDHVQLFMLKEKVLEDFEDDPAVAACLDTIVGLLEALVGAGYFLQNRSGLEVFQTLRPLIAFELTPFLLEVALDAVIDDEQTERLLNKSVSNGLCYGYEAW